MVAKQRSHMQINIELEKIYGFFFIINVVGVVPILDCIMVTLEQMNHNFNIIHVGRSELSGTPYGVAHMSKRIIKRASPLSRLLLWFINRIAQINMSDLFLGGVVLFDASADHRLFVNYLQVIARSTFGTLIIAATYTSWASFASAPRALHPSWLQSKTCVRLKNSFWVLSASALELTHSFGTIRLIFRDDQLIYWEIRFLISYVTELALLRGWALGATIFDHGVGFVEGTLVTCFTSSVHQSKIIHAVEASGSVTFFTIGRCAFWAAVVLIFEISFFTNCAFGRVVYHWL